MNPIKYKKMMRMSSIVSLAWLAYTATIALGQRDILFKPVRTKEVVRPRSRGHRTRAIVLRSRDGTQLAGWWMTPRAPGPHPAVIYFGGRAEEVSWVARDAWRMFPNIAVLAINYRGYGDSRGIPGESQIIDDAAMQFDWLAKHPAIAATQIAVVGRSLGSGVAVQLAASRPVAAAILITPYDSVQSLAKRHFPSIPGFVFKHRFDSALHAALLLAPTMIVRAAADDVVPFPHTDTLVAQFVTPPQEETIPESNHKNIPYLALTQERIALFLKSQFAQFDST